MVDSLKHKPQLLQRIKAKMPFWSLHFGLILNLVLKLITSKQSMISENHFYFGLCHQPNNRKYIRDKQNALLTYLLVGILEADVANKIK